MNTVKIENSKNNHPVPIINDVYLHSIFDPITEAASLANEHMEKISGANKILVLGLGFGYHIEAICELAKEIHSEVEIVVLEANEDLVEEYRKYNVSKGFKIICESNIDALYSDVDFLDFLLEKPAVIAHPSSLELNKKYYRNFLNFTASTAPKDYNHKLKGHFENYFSKEETDIETRIFNINNSGRAIDKKDFSLLAFNEIIQTAGI